MRRTFYTLNHLADTDEYTILSGEVKEARIKTEESNNSASQENLYPQMTLKGSLETLNLFFRNFF